MRRIIFFVLAFLVAVSSAAALPDRALAYKETQVKNGGSLTGTVTLKGDIPVPRIFPLVLYPFGTFCTKNERISDGKGSILLKEFTVSPEGGLKDTVISIEDIESGKTFPPIHVKIFSRNCEFLPFVTVVQNHGQLTIVNEDPLIHNSQLYQVGKGNVILNVPIAPNSTDTHVIRFQKHKRLSQMICGFHEFMQTWGFAVENPYNAVSDENGNFFIDDIPPGTYRVAAWHPHFDIKEKEITVRPGKKVSLNFEFEGDEVERPNYETQEKFRIGPRGEEEEKEEDDDGEGD